MRFSSRRNRARSVSNQSIQAADPIDSQIPSAAMLLRVKELAMANQRPLLLEAAAQVADVARVESSAVADRPYHPGSAQSMSVRRGLAYILIALSLCAAVLLICQLAKYATFSAALLAVLLAAMVSSTVGFAFSAIAAGILLQIIADQVAVVEIMLISSIALQIYCVAALWRDIALGRIAWFLLGGLLTLPVGVYALLTLNTPLYAILIGVVLTAYGAITLVRPASAINWGGGRLADAIVGSTGGITGPLVAFPGALVAIWCNARGLDKLSQRCVYQPYILVMQIATLAFLSTLGEANRIDATYALFAIPAVVGAHIGFNIFQKMTDGQFRKLVNGLLIVSGLGILAKGFL